MELDCVIVNGLIATASEVLPLGLEIGVRQGKISCIGSDLPRSPGTSIIDAQGAYVTPGGVDSHVHVQQDNALTGDTWETGTRSAVAGGTTTIIAFASQKRHETSLMPVVSTYHDKARGESYCDYGFHVILTNPTQQILNEELPVLAQEQGITSVKLYMTYDPLKLNDREMLYVMMRCRSLGMTTMIHAENADMISLIIEGLQKNGNMDTWFHSVARPRIAEDEATYRAIALAELVDSPILLVHMSSESAIQHVREAQARLLPIHAETCPHYLFLLSEELKGKPAYDGHFHGAKAVCSPPLRHRPEDLDALWRAVTTNTFTVISSDHAPSTFDHPGGKKLGLINGKIPVFTKIPNGVPGVETRLSLLFSQSEACLPFEEAKMSVPQFVQMTATNGARLYGLQGCKGNIAPGYDADFVIWHPNQDGSRVIRQANLHHGVDYTPFEGMNVLNWPRYTIIRGQVVWNADEGGITGQKGFGDYLVRSKGEILVGKTGRDARGMTAGERQLWQ
ncbi:D-hydantoinase [Thozetella sp. PMI_491]|nr:D-hydantoinase [Thozetella sp. PMI_491]